MLAIVVAEKINIYRLTSLVSLVSVGSTGPPTEKSDEIVICVVGLVGCVGGWVKLGTWIPKSVSSVCCLKRRAGVGGLGVNVSGVPVKKSQIPVCLLIQLARE